MENDILFVKSWMMAACGFYLISSLAYLVDRKRVAVILLATGLLSNSIALIGRGYIEKAWYPALMVPELFVLPAAMALTVGFLFKRQKIVEGRVALVPFVACCCVTMFLPVEAVLPWVKHQTASAALFFLTEALSCAVLVIAGACACASLLSKAARAISYHRLILWGFLAFTLCQISGAVWAYLGWSYPFSWSPRHLTSASLWCLYAALIHAHFTGIQARLQAILAAFGIIPFVYMVYHHEIVTLLEVISERLA